MIVWMRNHAHELKGELEANAAAALAAGSSGALILMAFLAVLREGFETAVFLLALLQSSNNATTTFSGAALGVVLSALIGTASIDCVAHQHGALLRITGFVLVLVAAGLMSSAAHTAWEAGWLNVPKVRR